jgi:hypothetical protein
VTRDLQVAVVRRLLYPDTDVLQRIAYDVVTSAAALGVTTRRMYALLHNAHIPSNNTGKSYLIAGGTLIDIHRGPLDGINDHRDPQVFDADRLYSRANLAVLFGVGTHVVRGLVERGRIEESEAVGYARYVPGSAVAEFLASPDEPMRETG